VGAHQPSTCTAPAVYCIPRVRDHYRPSGLRSCARLVSCHELAQTQIGIRSPSSATTPLRESYLSSHVSPATGPTRRFSLSLPRRPLKTWQRRTVPQHTACCPARVTSRRASVTSATRLARGPHALPFPDPGVFAGHHTSTPPPCVTPQENPNPYLALAVLRRQAPDGTRVDRVRRRPPARRRRPTPSIPPQ
jgi:hypothetical protein